MGYFSNGTEGEEYRTKYCEDCKNNTEDCAIWAAHLMHNYAEGNNKGSILHLLIPMNDKGENLMCRMYMSDE